MIKSPFLSNDNPLAPERPIPSITGAKFVNPDGEMYVW
jgi:hypothetical protein